MEKCVQLRNEIYTTTKFFLVLNDPENGRKTGDTEMLNFPLIYDDGWNHSSICSGQRFWWCCSASASESFIAVL